MKQIVIVEDEPIIAADLSIMIQRLGYDVLQTFDTGEEALPFIIQHQPDLVLLDIELAGGLTGIQVAETLTVKYTIPFMFLTSFSDSDTVARIKPLKPAAYLIKPIQELTLSVNVELALMKSRHSTRANKSSDADKIFVKSDSEFVALAPADILFIEAYDNYAYVHTVLQKYLLTHTLKSVEEKLVSRGFFRVHKSYMINLARITSVQETMVVLDSIEIPIGKTYKRELLNAITIL